MEEVATTLEPTQCHINQKHDEHAVVLSRGLCVAIQGLASAAGVSEEELVGAALTCWCQRVKSWPYAVHNKEGSSQPPPTPGDWSRLPSELAALILDRLSPAAIRAARLCCRAWTAHADAHVRDVTVRVRALPASDDDVVADDGRRSCAPTWARMRSLSSLCIHHNPVQDAAILPTLHCLALLPGGALTGLTSLRIDTHRSPRRSAAALPSGRAFGDTHLMLLLTELRNLRSLSLPGSLVTAVGVRDGVATGSLHALSALDLSGASRLRCGDCVSALGQLTNLTRLNLSDCGTLREGEAEGLRMLPSCLCSLALANCGVDDAAASALAALTALTHLDLSYTVPTRTAGRALHGFPADGGPAGRLTDAALAHLAALTALTDLRLAGQVRLSCRGLESLRPLSALANLDLQACSWGVVTEGVPQLRHFPRLWSLDLSGAPDDIVSLPGQVIAALAGLSGLAKFHLRNQFDLTAADLVGLASLPSLTSLDLMGCCFRADDEVLPSLGGLTRLQHLGLSETLDQEISRRPTLLQPLNTLSRLESIDLRGNVFAPIQLAALARLPALKEVQLDPDEAAFDVGGAQLVKLHEAMRLLKDSLAIVSKVITCSN